MQTLYFSDELIGAGLPILTKDGAIAKQRLIEYISRLLLDRGYIPIASPHIGNLSLFSKSGHYPFYKDSMFPVIEGGDNGQFALKPMNCPFHIMAYKKMGIISYRELPMKFYEFGQVYRYEDSGALNGLYRLRSFTQDDGHLFCSIDQIGDIVKECIELIKIICKSFRLELTVKYSSREENNKEKYIGSSNDWDISQDILRKLCKENFGENYMEDRGGAAFYGPKIDFIASDKLSRQWQLGTIQLDFNLGERFDIGYINEENKKEVPVIIHRALLGSLERFLGILVENNLLPLYLQPFNMGIIWIGKDELYLENIVSRLKNIGIYPTVLKTPKNLSDAMVQLYQRDINNIVIIGRKEEANNMVNFNKKDYPTEEYFGVVSELFRLD